MHTNVMVHALFFHPRGFFDGESEKDCTLGMDSQPSRYGCGIRSAIAD